MISRAVVGRICVEALLHAPSCTTLNCKEDPAAAAKPGSLKDVEWHGVLGALKKDGPIPATFEDHVSAVQSFKVKIAGAAVAVTGLLMFTVYTLMS